MTETADPMIDEHSQAPRFSWKALLVMLVAAGSLVGSYEVANGRINSLTDHVNDVDRRGTVGLQNHISATKDELNEIRVQLEGTRKDVQALREFLDWRLSVIETRLGVPAPRRSPASRDDQAPK